MLTSTISSASANAASAPAKDLGTKDIFLKILIAQMQFQDPLKPQDAAQMSTQLAQFNMVEQQTNTNTLLEQLVANGSSTSKPTDTSTNAASYLGHTATIAIDALNYSGTAMPFSINLGANASHVSVQILDAGGLPVRNMQLGGMQAGNTQVSWDGKDDTGAIVPQGTYQTVLQASDSQGQPMNVFMLQQGMVNAVRFTASGPEFVVAGMQVPQAAIQEIKL